MEQQTASRPIETTTSPALETHGRTLRRAGLWKRITVNWELYLFILPALAIILLFKYGPMYGLQIAFKSFSPALGIQESPWVGLRYFEQFFNSFYFWTAISNTVVISLYQIVAAFPVPIILALILNNIPSRKYKKTVQLVTYAPHFISTVVLVGLIHIMLSPTTGAVNKILEAMGLEAIFFMQEPQLFKTIYVFSGVWQNMGYASIIYLAALSAVDPQLHEAAIVDGATKLQRIWNIEIPTLVPTMLILLILNVGRLFTVGFEKVYLMQNPMIINTSEIIATYVYRTGILQGRFSLATAVGLVNAVANFIMLYLFNRFAKRVGQVSLW